MVFVKIDLYGMTHTHTQPLMYEYEHHQFQHTPKRANRQSRTYPSHINCMCVLCIFVIPMAPVQNPKGMEEQKRIAHFPFGVRSAFDMNECNIRLLCGLEANEIKKSNNNSENKSVVDDDNDIE